MRVARKVVIGVLLAAAALLTVAKGAEYRFRLATLPATGRRGRPGTTGDWRPTPVAAADARWSDPAGCDLPGVHSAQACPGIGLFLNR